jgi:3-oxoadipate enol-lactonase
MNLAFDDAGSGPAVVLLHGHPFDRTMWAPQLDALAGRFRVLVPDLRGFGESPVTPGTVTMRELADDVWQLLDECSVETVAAVGLSMGGLVAMELALATPQRLWALGLVATTARPVTDEERAQRLRTADELEAEGMEPLVEAMAPRLFGPGVEERVVDGIVATMRRTDPRGAAAALRGRAERPDYRPGLEALSLPSFVCTGTADSYSTADVTAELVGSLRGPVVVSLPEIGHLPNLEATARFDAELTTFLAAAV